jgi:hypothetical protein
MKELVKNKDTDKLLHILHELTKMESLTPTGWLTAKIMAKAEKEGIITNTEYSACLKLIANEPYYPQDDFVYDED